MTEERLGSPPDSESEEYPREEFEAEKAVSEGAEEERSSREELLQQLEEWREKADEYLDKYRRSVAELSNYRKRQERERAEQALRTKAAILRQFLAPVDDFERAIDSIPREFANDGWVDGILLIERKLKSVLDAFQVVPMETLGKPFDPNFHSALMQCASQEYPEGTVMEEMVKGYLIDGRVLRPAMVKVSMGCEPQANAESEAK